MKKNSRIITSSPWGFRFFKLADYAKALKKIGIDQLCLMTGRDSQFPLAITGGEKGGAQAKKILKDNGCSAIEIAVDKNDLTDLDLAAAVGAKYVRVCEIWPHTVEEMKHIGDQMHYLAERCADFGMKLIIENHGGLLADSLDCVRFFDEVGHENAYLNYDAANFWHYGDEEPIHALNVTAPYIGFAHLKNVTKTGLTQGEFCRISKGIIDYKPLMNVLQDTVDNDVPFCLEYERPEDVIKGTSDDYKALIKLLK